MKEMSPPEESPCTPALAGGTLGLISPTFAVSKLGRFPKRAHPACPDQVNFLDTPWNDTHHDGEMHRPGAGADLVPSLFH